MTKCMKKREKQRKIMEACLNLSRQAFLFVDFLGLMTFNYNYILFARYNMGILKKIEIVRQQLHLLLDQNASYDMILNKSVELDVLISSYYRVSKSSC